VAIFLGLLMVRGKIDRAAILLAGVAELIFLADPWVYWASLPLTFLAFAWWATAGNSAAIAAVRIVPRSDRAIAPGAQDDVDRYLPRDYEVVGSADVSGSGFETFFTNLLSQDRFTYAVATDRVRCIASVFGDRVMVSISQVNSIVDPKELRQWVWEDSMTITMDTHAAGLGVLASFGHQPDSLPPEDVVGFSIEIDEASKAYAIAHRWEYFRSMLRGFSRVAGTELEAPHQRRTDPAANRDLGQQLALREIVPAGGFSRWRAPPLTSSSARLEPPTSPAVDVFSRRAQVAKFRSNGCLTNDNRVITVVYPPQ
jgi:hypothetical protein